MVEADDPQSLFVTCARLVEFARVLPEAERYGSDVLLQLYRSQFARDGLAAATLTFTTGAGTGKLSREFWRESAIACAMKSPT